MSWLTDYMTDAVDEVLRPDPEDFGIPMAISGIALLVIGAACSVADNVYGPGLVVGGVSLMLAPVCAGVRWTVRWWRAKRSHSADPGRPELRVIDGGRR